MYENLIIFLKCPLLLFCTNVVGMLFMIKSNMLFICRFGNFYEGVYNITFSPNYSSGHKYVPPNILWTHHKLSPSLFDVSSKKIIPRISVLLNMYVGTQGVCIAIELRTSKLTWNLYPYPLNIGYFLPSSWMSWAELG